MAALGQPARAFEPDCASSVLMRNGVVLASGFAVLRDTTIVNSSSSCPTPTICFAYFDSTCVDWSDRRIDAAVRYDWLGSTTFEVRDTYVLRGPADGTPVQVTARITASGTLWAPCGSSGCRPETNHVILASGQVLASLWTYGRNSFAETLETTIVRPAGEPFPLEFLLSWGGGHNPTTIECTASLDFTGLPPGARIESCLDAGSPTSARRSSWGALKSIYR